MKQRAGPGEPAPTEAGPHLEGLGGGAARLRPHGRDLRIHRPPGFRLHNISVGRIDEDADDGRPELLGRVEDDDGPEIKETV